MYNAVAVKWLSHDNLIPCNGLFRQILPVVIYRQRKIKTLTIGIAVPYAYMDKIENIS